VNDVTRLQALVDKKKVVVTEATIREALHLDNAEGVDCLSNEDIFVELARMGYEKPSTKLTFYKAFFSSQWNLVRNVDSPTKFYMYPCFLQLMIRKQVGNLSTHTTKYTSPALTQKVFANIKRVGKGFSEVETPLSESMLLEQQVVEEGDADENDETVNAGDVAEGDVSAAHGEVPTVDEEPSIPYTTPPTPPPQPPQDIPSTSHTHITLEITKLKRRVRKLERRNKGRMIAKMDQNDAVVMEDDKEEDREDDETEPAEVQEVVDVVTTIKLITEVVTATSAIITAAEAQVPAATIAVILTTAPARVAAAPSRRRKGVVIRDPEEESTTFTIIHAETKSKDKSKGILSELNKNIDWDEAIDHVKRKAKEDPAFDYFKGMSYDDICPIFEAKFNSNVAFLLKKKEQIKEDEYRALKTSNETLAKRASKRQKLDEEVEELKRHLQIVPNEDDDVYTEATPLARKVPVVDYQIIEMNNKPYYNIIRADNTHQLYISFLSLLRNFDREDLEAL
nr:hypothetical protein [Tanacetum cinerariifolium]